MIFAHIVERKLGWIVSDDPFFRDPKDLDGRLF